MAIPTRDVEKIVGRSLRMKEGSQEVLYVESAEPFLNFRDRARKYREMMTGHLPQLSLKELLAEDDGTSCDDFFITSTRPNAKSVLIDYLLKNAHHGCPDYQTRVESVTKATKYKAIFTTGYIVYSAKCVMQNQIYDVPFVTELTPSDYPPCVHFTLDQAGGLINPTKFKVFDTEEAAKLAAENVLAEKMLLILQAKDKQ